MSQITINENPNRVVVTENSTGIVVKAFTEGPQGPAGGGATQLGDLADVNTTARVNKSVLYYDGATSTFKADAIWTTSELTDGGNF